MLRNLKSSFFGGESNLSLSDAVREQRKNIARSIRSLDRQHVKAEAEEKKVFQLLKAQAISGVQKIDRVHAKQLILVRRRRSAILRCKAQLGAADLQVQQQQVTQELHKHFKVCSKLVSLVNEAAEFQTMQAAVKEFTRECHKLGLMDEMLNEVLEDGTAQLEEETEEEVLKEIFASAQAELEAQLLESDLPLRPPAASPLSELQKPQQQQQLLQQPLQQQQQLLARSKSRLSPTAHCFTQDEAALAYQLEQRLGSLLR